VVDVCFVSLAKGQTKQRKNPRPRHSGRGKNLTLARVRASHERDPNAINKKIHDMAFGHLFHETIGEVICLLANARTGG